MCYFLNLGVTFTEENRRKWLQLLECFESWKLWKSQKAVIILENNRRTLQLGSKKSWTVHGLTWYVNSFQPVISAKTHHPRATAGPCLMRSNDTATSFSDSASTAMFASVTPRMAALTGYCLEHILAGNLACLFIQQSVDAEGWLRGTVDFLTFATHSSPTGVSPDDQAFVLLLESVHGDFFASFHRKLHAINAGCKNLYFSSVIEGTSDFSSASTSISTR